MDKIYYVTASSLNVRSGPGINFDKWELLYKGDRILGVSVPSCGWLAIRMDDDSVGYVSEQYVSEEQVQPEFHLVEPMYRSDLPSYANIPIWLEWMLSKLGLEEIPGAGDNPEIIEWMKLTTLPRNMWHDSVSWCSVAVNASFLLNEMEGTRSARAFDWLEWGETLITPQLGCVVVLNRFNAHGSIVGGHVGLWLSETSDKIQLIGGNQNNAITKQWYKKVNLRGYRWPKE